MLFVYLYQAPVMSSAEAIIKAQNHLNNLPKEWGESLSCVDLKEIPPEDIRTSLNQRDGLWNRLTNKKQWEVTINFNGTEPTVIMNAYTGKFIDIYGPLN
jgi:hypothetical protein